MQILEQGGLLLSELAPEKGPLAEHFPRRNRIISGLSLATVVVEAPARSGALITVGFAADQGRDVYAVPGSILSGASEGTNRLLRQVAELEKTCDLQRGRIADLQRQIPAESVGEDPKPYVGLKQLLTGNSDTPAGDRTP